MEISVHYELHEVNELFVRLEVTHYCCRAEEELPQAASLNPLAYRPAHRKGWDYLAVLSMTWEGEGVENIQRLMLVMKEEMRRVMFTINEEGVVEKTKRSTLLRPAAVLPAEPLEKLIREVEL